MLSEIELGVLGVVKVGTVLTNKYQQPEDGPGDRNLVVLEIIGEGNFLLLKDVVPWNGVLAATAVYHDIRGEEYVVYPKARERVLRATNLKQHWRKR